MARSSKYASDRPLADRVKHYFRGIFTDEEIDLSRERRNQIAISDETLDDIVERYVPEPVEAVEKVVEEPVLELTDRKSLYFETEVYAEAKEWAKKEGLTLSAYVNRAVKNSNLACHIQEDMAKELNSREEVLLKCSENLIQRCPTILEVITGFIPTLMFL